MSSRAFLTQTMVGTKLFCAPEIMMRQRYNESVVSLNTTDYVFVNRIFAAADLLILGLYFAGHLLLRASLALPRCGGHPLLTSTKPTPCKSAVTGLDPDQVTPPSVVRMIVPPLHCCTFSTASHSFSENISTLAGNAMAARSSALCGSNAAYACGFIFV